jgi:hypothetical protein
MSPRRRQALARVALPGVAGLASFIIYLRTLYPGLVGSGDTPELQFAGKVLGIPHVPGYPVYTLLSHAFSWLPVGSPAYRVNLMSAVFGAVAVALFVMAARRLGVRPAAATAAALALGCSRTFWSQATLAEVYTLAAALLLACVACLLRWDETRRLHDLLGAVAFASVSLAHHSSDVAAVAPALLAFVLLTDARAGLALRVWAAGAGLVALLGLLPYGLVLLRTRQRAPYLGARAENLGELLDVMTGRAFAGRAFAFEARAVLADRAPLVAGLVRDELGLLGLVLAVMGLIALARRRPRVALLLVLAAAGPTLFALGYDVPDLAVFLIPAFLFLWLLAARGLEASLAALLRFGVHPVVAAAAAFTLPAVQLAGNFKASDHSGRSFETRYFDAIFAALPARSAIVTESYTVDQMVRYQILAEGWGTRKELALSGRDRESIGAYLRRGFAVFAFERGKRQLTALGYAFEPIGFRDAPLSSYLTRQVPGAAVLFAGCPEPNLLLRAALAGPLGIPADAATQRCVAGLGLAGARGGDAVAGPDGAVFTLAAGSSVGSTGRSFPVDVRAEADVAGSRLLVKDKLVETTRSGLALAVLNAAGQVVERHDVDATEDGPWVPLNRRAFPFYRLKAVAAGERRGPDGSQGASVP